MIKDINNSVNYIHLLKNVVKFSESLILQD